jgi:hypothetical protein
VRHRAGHRDLRHVNFARRDFGQVHDLAWSEGRSIHADRHSATLAQDGADRFALGKSTMTETIALSPCAAAMLCGQLV